MGNGFAETSVHKIDQKKFEENYKKIKWCECNNEKEEYCDKCKKEQEDEPISE